MLMEVFAGSALLGLAALWLTVVRLDIFGDRIVSEALATSVSFERSVESVRSLVMRVNAESLDAYQRIKVLEGLLDGGTAIDVGIKECGWLIAVARVNGRDCVRIQKMHRDMTLRDYDELVAGLNFASHHVQFIDGPNAETGFLEENQRRRGYTRPGRSRSAPEFATWDRDTWLEDKSKGKQKGKDVGPCGL